MTEQAFVRENFFSCGEKSPPLAVMQTNGTLGLISVEKVPKGRMLFVIEGDLTDRASRYSVQVGPNTHIDLLHALPLEVMCSRHPWRFMNHSCDPSAGISDRAVIALRDIAAGDQVTFNYNTTEWEIAEPFHCQCRTASCLGKIRGYKFLSTKARERLGNAAAGYLTQRRSDPHRA